MALSQLSAPTLLSRASQPAQRRARTLRLPGSLLSCQTADLSTVVISRTTPAAFSDWAQDREWCLPPCSPCSADGLAPMVRPGGQGSLAPRTSLNFFSGRRGDGLFTRVARKPCARRERLPGTGGPAIVGGSHWTPRPQILGESHCLASRSHEQCRSLTAVPRGP